MTPGKWFSDDIQSGARVYMSAEELKAKIEQDEADAIEFQLSKTYPKEVQGYNYKELLTSILHKNTLEAQFVSYVDKLDAYNESMHEFHAGNISFLESVMFYAQAFARFPVKYPALAERSWPTKAPRSRISTTERGAIASRFQHMPRTSNRTRRRIPCVRNDRVPVL